MCTKNDLELILSYVARQSKLLFSDKLDSVVLFGSYARGDYDDESDIDIMILADINNSDITQYTRKLRNMICELELDYDCVLAPCIVSKEVFNRFKDILPFYRNVEKEGVRIAV